MRCNDALIQKNQILEIIIKKVEKDFYKDISVVVCYGSFVTGGYKDDSDIDFFFIPKSNKGFDLSYQFIINGIGYDFWPVSWERANKIVNLEEQILSIIMEGKVIFYSSKNDLRKFNNLKKRAVKNLTDKNLLKSKIDKCLFEIKYSYFDIIQAKDNIIIAAVYTILEKLLFIIALLNGKYLLKGIKNIDREVAGFSIIPKDFLNDYKKLIKFKNNKTVQLILLKMINDISELINSQFKNRRQKTNTDELIGFYEEFKSMYNKLTGACKAKNYEMVLYSAVMICKETDAMLQPFVKKDYFPDIIGYLDPINYQYIMDACIEHEQKLIKMLNKYKIPIHKFKNANDFEQEFLFKDP